jgi:hypothetical protein
VEIVTQAMKMEPMMAVVMKANKTDANFVPNSATSRPHLARARSVQYF